MTTQTVHVVHRGALALLAIFVTLPPAHAAYTYGTDASTNTVASKESTKLAAQQAVQQVSSRISAAVSGGASTGINPTNTSQAIGDGTGRAAGDGTTNAGWWLDVAHSWIEKDDRGNTADFDADVTTLVAGVDYKWKKNLLIGLAVGYEDQDIDSSFNNGGMDGEGYSISPYVGYSFNDDVRMDMMFGFADLRYHSERNNGAVKGNTDAQRIFGAINLHYDLWEKDDRFLQSTFGYLWVNEDQDDFTESDGTLVDDVHVRLGQARATLKGGFTYRTNGLTFSPFASARLEYDVEHNEGDVINVAGDRAADDRFGVTFGLGSAFSLGERTTLTLQGESTEFRENLDAYKLSGTLRYDF